MAAHASSPATPPQGRRMLARALRPLRVKLAKLALVEEERDRRSEAITAEVSASEGRLDARITELERLRSEVRRAQRENAAILRLLGGTPGREAGEGPAPPIMVSHRALFAEVERGSRAEVKEKIAPYVERFRGKELLVDLGCGRGEFLELATIAGLDAYGVDSDPEAVAACRALGLDARAEDLLEHLEALPSESVGGVFCSQVVEHLPAELFPVVVDGIARALRPGGVAIIETPNPATFATHVQSFWRDPTHTRPVPESALSFAARTAGLVVDDVIYSSPVPERDRLHSLDLTVPEPEVEALVDALNRMIGQLNDLLYGYQDFALVASKPE